MKDIEYHPLEPFLPSNSQLLMVGSFPPKKERWAMDFFYPNLQNDMWRIFGIVFFEDKEYFKIADGKLFDKNKIEEFLKEKGIAVFDTAKAIIRHKDNASDNFLEVVESTDLEDILRQIPSCRAIVTTGQKASDTLANTMNIPIPKIGNYEEFIFSDRNMSFYRMPSTSRAYPLAIEKKAAVYRIMFEQLGMV